MSSLRRGWISVRPPEQLLSGAGARCFELMVPARLRAIQARTSSTYQALIRSARRTGRGICPRQPTARAWPRRTGEYRYQLGLAYEACVGKPEGIDGRFDMRVCPMR